MSDFKKSVALLLLLGGLLFAGQARAQFIGYTSPQTVTSTAFNAAGCTGADQFATVPNLGQAAHYVNFQGSSIQNLEITLQGSNDNSVFFDISETGTGNGNALGTISGTGYYTVVRVRVRCNAGGSITAFYSGLSVTPGQYVGGQLTSQLVKFVAVGATAGSGFVSDTIRSPFGSSGGTLYFKFAAAGPASSSISVTCTTDTSGGFQASYILALFNVATANTQQIFPVPAATCPFFTFTYNSGGASATNFTALYAFDEVPSTPPGYRYTNITSNASTQVKSAPGFLHLITTNNAGTTETLTLFDNTACSGTKIGTVAVAAGTLNYDVAFNIGLCIISAGGAAGDWSVSWQ